MRRLSRSGKQVPRRGNTRGVFGTNLATVARQLKAPTLQAAALVADLEMSKADRTGLDEILPSYLQDEVVCPRHPVIQALKPVLASSRAVLPEVVYKALYDILFASYKSALRGLYLRNVADRWLAGDRAGFFRA